MLTLALALPPWRCVGLLLEANASPNVSAANEVTPLHLACQGNHARSAKLLLDANANVDAVDRDGVPPLYLADAQKHRECSKLLISYGAQRGSGTLSTGE